MPDLKILCLINPDNIQLDQRQRDRCVLGRNILPPRMHRLPALHRRSLRYLRPPRASHVVDLTLHRRHAPLLPVTKLHGATCRTNNPRRGRVRHHRPHHGDIRRYHPPSTAAQILESDTNHVGFWNDCGTFGWGTVRTARVLEMGLHHQLPLLCLEPCHRACGCQAQI